MDLFVVALFLGGVCWAANGQPELVDTLFREGFDRGLSELWRPYDNWSKPEFSVADGSPLGLGPALRIVFDDKTTLHHYDKGAVVTLRQPLPWAKVDFISARYRVDKKVGNLRIFCHCDQGGWWDYTQPRVVVGKPALLTASRDDFRLAWTDNPQAPPPDKTGRILQIFFSAHNPGAVNQGEKRVLWLDDVLVGTWLLPLRQPLATAGSPLKCWVLERTRLAPAKLQTGPPPMSELAHWAALPCGEALLWAAVHDDSLELVGLARERAALRVNGKRVAGAWWTSGGRQWFAALLPAPESSRGDISLQYGDEQWSGRYVLARPLKTFEALGLSVRTGAVHLAPTRPVFFAGQSLFLSLDLPMPWAEAKVEAALASESGEQRSLKVAETQSRWWGRRKKLALAQPGTALLGLRRAQVTLSAGEEPLVLHCQVRVEEVDREALEARKSRADAAASKLVELAGQGQGESWWAHRPLQVRPLVRDRRRVDPAQWSQLDDPVTWQDLGGGFLGGAQCGIDEQSLRTYFDHYDFGGVVKPHLGYFLREGWCENIKRVASRGLIVTSVWGYVPNVPWNGGFGDVKVPRQEHDEILRLLGRHFLGYEMGEQDGRYIGGYAPRHQPSTRAEAKRYFYQWHKKIVDNFFGRMVALASLNFQHEYARLGLRMLGIEASQALPSDTMQWAFLRGACKQYGLLAWNCISIFNRWGYKSYTSTGKGHGPDKGPSLSLLRRLWYVTYMYGSAINMFESAYLLPEKDEQGFPRLSPVGRMHCQAVRWARQHRARGVPYTPVAIMLHRDAGWVPPRHLYTGKRYLVWGNLPYSRADHATDALFRLIWPGYQDCSYYKDERGYLTPTPYGDMFDVIFDDTSQQCLRRYQMVIVVSETGLEDAASVESLLRFVRDGGEVVADPVAARQLGPPVTGVKITAERRTAQRSVLLPEGEVLAEEPYSYVVARPQGARALVLSEHGDGTMWEHSVGRGRVVVCCSNSYVAAETRDPQKEVDVPLHHKLLRGFARVLDAYLRGLALVRVEGDTREIGYLCNVSGDVGQLLVTLVNNGGRRATVRVRARGKRRIVAMEDWLGTAKIREGTVEVALPAGDLAIVRLRLALQ